jgi:hypothetical protein
LLADHDAVQNPLFEGESDGKAPSTCGWTSWTMVPLQPLVMQAASC